MKSINIKGLSDLPKAAEELLRLAAGRSIVALYGPMGAGKTTLIKEICRACGVTEIVTSPTFSIVNIYLTESGEPIYHFDCYRLERPEEAYDFGYEEYLFSGHLCLIEWPEKIEPLLPDDTMRVEITVIDPTERIIDIIE